MLKNQRLYLARDASLASETTRDLNLVQDMHSLGLLTFDSQDGVVAKEEPTYKYPELFSECFRKILDRHGGLFTGKKTITSAHEMYKSRGGSYVKRRPLLQRAYLCAITTEKEADALYYWLNRMGFVCTYNRWGVATDETVFIPMTYTTGTSIPGGSYTKVHPHAMVIPTAFVLPDSDQTPIRDLVGNSDLVEPSKQWAKKNLWVVCMFDPVMGRKASSRRGLFQEIVNVLKGKYDSSY